MISVTHRLALSILLTSLSASAAPEGERLGTLFYSPVERTAIASAREGKAETASGLTLSGIIKRDGGKGTVWVNRRPVPEGQPVPPAPTPTITSQGVTIDGKPVRVGETVNLVTGERTDIVPAGAVSTGKSK